MVGPETRPGDFVVFKKEITEQQANGYFNDELGCDDPRKTLFPGVVYEVEGVDVRKWITYLYLRNEEGRFNAACFRDAV